MLQKKLFYAKHLGISPLLSQTGVAIVISSIFVKGYYVVLK